LLNKWQDFIYPLQNQLLQIHHLSNALIELWKLFNQGPSLKGGRDENNLIQIQFKVQLHNGLTRSISYVQTINKNDYNLLLDSFKEFWNIRSDSIFCLSQSSKQKRADKVAKLGPCKFR